MKLTRIPLKERLERIRSGYAGDEKYDISVIIRFANIPIADYLGAFPEEYGMLLRCLRIRPEDASHMTYRDVAKRVEEYYDSGEDMRRAVRALEILAMPFNRCYEERRRQYHE